ncbi:MAG: hypothetical protein A3B03_00840 [Candidatus Zambryskibacteria bacterium RIFCSPLOWO2_01_FULL_42_41]|nr:MAG: hypothetical protein A2829_01600 [Candidatus Zambryskibacteria bacterium RIFCSPHIGHO2_01_FULL_43_60]OHB03991.1 MAG: hypothetical protein A3B03_00840 [Candidatus Zambryskibacteria bacterium RIFCSPLOWO2_01_FULL_42_41]
MSTTIIKIVGRGVLLAGFFALVVSALYAREAEPGITFATYGIDLKIDSEASYNGLPVPSGTWDLKNLVPGSDHFFNFDDIKPGDYGENTISMHVKKSDAWLCLDFKNLDENENGVNEPESHEDVDGVADGELAEVMEFFSWLDDGDNIFELGEKPLFGTATQSAVEVLNEKTYTIGDAGQGGSCKINQSRYIGIYWCAGDLEVNLDTAEITCDGSGLGNETQTDSMTVDVSIRALPAKENKDFRCTDGFEEIEGCSPGYWKQSQHFDDWTAPYTPSKKFSTVFENAFPNKSLLQVLNQGGGGLNALGRQTVAALLNAANPDIDFAYTVAEVINMFNAVYPGGDYETLKDLFEEQNTIFCPLSMSGGYDDEDDDDDHSNNDYDGHDDKKDKRNINHGITGWFNRFRWNRWN